MGECVVKTILAVAMASLLLTAVPQGQTPFSVEEATIAQVHAAMKAKRLTCRQLVDAYIDRIARYDKPNINAIVITNPDARREADALDRQFAQRGLPVRSIAYPRSSKTTSRPSACRALTGRCLLRASCRARTPSGQAHQGGRRDRPRQVEHGRVRVQSARDRELDPRHHAQSLRHDARARWLERRHGGGRGRQLRIGWPRL